MADKPNKLAFLSMQAPAGYVAGLGRGASGFTTRADIGPARLPTSSTPSKPADEDASNENDDDGDDDEEGRFQDPENETGLFAGGVYEKDDEDADRIWEEVDRKMDERRRKFREAREREEREKERREKPKFTAQFADLKRGLSAVTEDEWASLTESGSVTGKRRKAAAKREARNTRSFAISDTILIGNRDRNAVESTLTSDQMTDSAEDAQGGTITSLSEIGEARNKILSHTLDAASSSTSTPGTATSIDPKGYLTELSSSDIKTDAEIGDIKKARSLLDSVIKTNPSHAPGWIAAARVEEVAGKMSNARKIIAQGCEHCPRSQDIWLESARLNTKDNAKVILARSIQYCSQSVNIWLKAVELETDAESKKRVLRKSLEYIPGSVKLWKELVNLEDNPEDARILLSGAVAAVPLSVDLWLALARLSEPNEAKKVLNEARKTVPTSHEVWIAAARLVEETEADEAKVDKTVAAAVKALNKAGVEMSRDQWFDEAERVEKEGSPLTCSAIIKATISLEVEDEDRRAVWVEDAQSALERGCIEAARTIYAITLSHFPDRPAIWTRAVEVERQHSNRENLEALLERAVTACPKAEDLWLEYARSKAKADDIAGARQVLIRAFDANIGSEKVSLAAARLEWQHGSAIAAARLLERARVEVGTPRVWLKSAVLERDLNHSPAAAMALVDQAIAKFPRIDKFYMLGGQLKRLLAADTAQGVKEAREYFSRGLRSRPTSVPLWILSSRLEEEAGLVIRARALLEKARASNPQSELVWYESAQVESRAGSPTQAKTLLSRGLQELPSSGLLWSLAIAFEPRPGRKTKMADALKKTSDDARVIATVAQQFWLESKLHQARKWFTRAIQADPDYGDNWAFWFKFELQHGSQGSQAEVQKGVQKATPKHGLVWPQVAKDPQNASLDPADILKKVADQLTPLK